MSKITYTNKVDLYEDTSIADINKVKASDMNEIKTVVNNNDDTTMANTNAIGTLTDLSTTNKSSIVEAINELAYDSGWLDVNLNSDFSLYSADSDCKYRKVGKTVMICGQVKANKTLTEGIIFVLPVGFRPAYNMWFVQQGSGTAKWLLTLNTDGTVYAQRYGTNSGVDIKPTNWLPMSATFLVD